MPLTEADLNTIESRLFRQACLGLLKAFDTSQPRDRYGKWVKIEEIIEAAKDPEVADDLRARVTDPEERKELDERIVAASQADDTVSAAQAVTEVAKRRSSGSRKPIYSQEYYDYLDVAKAKKLKAINTEIAKLKDDQRNLRTVLSDPMSTDEQIFVATGRNDITSGFVATIRRWPQEAIDYYDEQIASLNRKSTKIENGESINFYNEVELEHARAVKRAVLAGRNVPMKVLRRYMHTDWMPNSKKELLASAEQIEFFRKDRETFSLMVEPLRTELRLVDPKLEELRLKVLNTEEAFNREQGVKLAELSATQSAIKAKAVDAFDRAMKIRTEAGYNTRDEVLELPDNHRAKVEYLAAYGEYESLKHEHFRLTLAYESASTLAADIAWDALKLDDGKGVVVIRESSSYSLSSEMLEGADRTGKMLGSIVNREVFGDIRYQIKEPAYGHKRAYSDGKDVFLLPHNSAQTVAHEVGHVIDGQNSTVGMISKTWMMLKTTGDVGRESWLGQGYEPDEVYAPDEFSQKYVGKWYPGRVSEVLSMGLENLYADPYKFARESPDHFKFVVGLLRGDLFGDAIRFTRQEKEQEASVQA